VLFPLAHRQTGKRVIEPMRIEFNNERSAVPVVGDTSLLQLLFSVALTQSVSQVQRQNR
jgi:hypothetical protein